MSMQYPLLKEDDVLETLNQQVDIHGLLMTGMQLIHACVEALMVKVFRTEHHAIRYVIPSLIGHHGPLSDLSVRLKLLYALGFISREEYEDIELVDVLLDEITNSDTQYEFMDREIIEAIKSLHHIHLPVNLASAENESSEAGIIDSVKFTLYQNRYPQMVRSALILALNSIITSIINKQKKDYFS